MHIRLTAVTRARFFPCDTEEPLPRQVLLMRGAVFDVSLEVEDGNFATFYFPVFDAHATLANWEWGVATADQCVTSATAARRRHLYQQAEALSCVLTVAIP